MRKISRFQIFALLTFVACGCPTMIFAQSADPSTTPATEIQVPTALAPNSSSDTLPAASVQSVIALPPEVTPSKGAPKKFDFTKIHTLGQVFDLSPEGPLHAAWEQVKISANGDLINASNAFTNGFSFGFSIKQNYLVQPAFINHYHQRLDQYTINLNLAQAFALYASTGLAVKTQVSFSRLFENKTKAMTAPFYFPNKIPWTANSAINDLKYRDMIRIDLLSGASVGPSGELDASHIDSKMIVGANLVRNSELVVDLYRMKDSLIRLRIVAIRHQLDVNASATLSLFYPIDFGAALIQKLLAGVISFDPLTVGGAANVRNRPVDTFMVDYVFDLSKPQAAEAFEETMGLLRRTKTYEFLNFQNGNSTIDARVLSLLPKAEATALADSSLPSDQRSIVRVFKGLSDNNYHSFFLQSRLQIFVPIWHKRIDTGNSIAQVRGYDHNDQPIDMLYLTRNSIHNFQAMAGKWQTLENNEVDTLFKAQPTDNGFVATDLSDIVMIKSLNDKKLSKRQFLRATNFVKLTVPTLAGYLPSVDFKTAPKVINGFYKFRLVIHSEVLNQMTKISKAEILKRLNSLISRDPFSSEISTTRPASNDENVRTLNQSERLEIDANIVADRFDVLLNDPTMANKFKAYSELREIELFEELGPALMISLLPADQIQKLIYMTVGIGGENLTPVNLAFGEKDVSDFFSSFQFMQTLLNSRTFDLRLQLNGSGQLEPIKDGKVVCENCDSLMTIGVTPAK